MDILSLRFIFTVDEIEDCGLHLKVLNAQTELAQAIDSAALKLRDYNLDRTELAAIVEAKIKAHALGLRRVLFQS
jgi:hypothetical protein